MSDYTDHYGLLKLGAGESLSTDSYKFTDADRDIIDRVLYQGATLHRHTGTTATSNAPTQALTSTLDQLGGSLAPGTQYWWVYTYSDENGNETSASPVVTETTDSQVAIPSVPTSSTSTTGGTLTEGQYYYAVTAYQGSTAYETLTGGLRTVSIPTGTITNTVTLTMGTLPTGADGYNIYRRTTGGSGIFYIGSTASTTFTDTGYAPNCDRTLPFANTTNTVNEVTLCLPGATPTVPAGYTWNLYRTYREDNWTNSLVARGITTGCYVDEGGATSAGQPPSGTTVTEQPSQVILTDAGEVQGNLPPGMVAHPFVAELHIHGTVATGTRLDEWVCCYPEAVIKGVRIAATGTPASTDIVADINLNREGATPVWASIFTQQHLRPILGPGFYVGEVTVPNVVTLYAGDQLSLDVDQAGGSATPTDANLKVFVYGWAYFDTTTSHSTGATPVNPPWV